MDYYFSEIFRWSSGKPVEITSGEIPVYGSNGVIGYTDNAKYNNKIILGRVGAYCGSVEYCKTDFNATDNTLITTCDTSKILYHYAYYMLKLMGLNRFAGGSAQPLITQGLLKHLKCSIPDLSTQEKIVSILSAYDELIERNKKQIIVLDEMCNNIYNEWFVRFRFPGHEDNGFRNSRIGRIPESFNVLKMREVFDSYIGGGWGNDEESTEYTQGAYVIRGADFPYVSKGDLSTCPYRYHKKSNYASRKLEDGDIIIEVSGGTAEQPVGRVVLVNKDTVERLDGTVICASFCKLIRLNKTVIRPEYYYYWMKFLYETRIIDRFQLQSTGIINFQFEFFARKGDVLMPPANLMNKFSDYIKDLNDEKSIIARQNENLIKQRDLLLPRLLSGKIQLK